MPYTVGFDAVSTEGLESSPVAEVLAGLRANEARYYKNKYNYDFTVNDASDDRDTVEYVRLILEKERGITIASEPLQTARFQVASLEMAYVFYKSGLVINVMYDTEDARRRAVGIKLSQGMDVPDELKDKFKFARQKSKLAGEIRGSFFVIKGEW
jgi:hypothetical protein